MMRFPTVKQLQYFLALTETEHFGKAAEACFVSQSALSSAIAELEEILGAQLVDRTNRQVTVTGIGQRIAVQARLCMSDLESLVELAQGVKEPLTGELRLGVIPTIAPFLLPQLLPRLRRKFPKLKLFLSEGQTEKIYRQLMDGELDVILLALPWEMRSVETEDLFRDPFCLAYCDGTDRVNPDNYRINQLHKDSILLLEDGHCLRDHALAACKIRNTQKIAPFAASSLLTLVEMVDADLGITYLPQMASGTSLLRNTRVKLADLSKDSFRTIGLAWRKGSRRADEFRMLGEFIVANK